MSHEVVPPQCQERRHCVGSSDQSRCEGQSMDKTGLNSHSSEITHRDVHGRGAATRWKVGPLMCGCVDHNARTVLQKKNPSSQRPVRSGRPGPSWQARQTLPRYSSGPPTHPLRHGWWNHNLVGPKSTGSRANVNPSSVPCWPK